MDMMTITQLAQQTDLAPPTVRRYLDDFILYVPSVRVDQTIGFPPEAIAVINTIHALTERGLSHSEILAKLEKNYPITVISAQPLAQGQSIPSSIPAITSLLKEVDERYGTLVQELGRLRSDVDLLAVSGPLADVPSELAQIRQVISMLAKRVADARVSPEPELAALRLELAELRSAVRDNWASASSPDALASLQNEIALLKHQLGEMRNERAHMFALMSNLQETLHDIRQDRIENLSSGPPPTQLFSISSQSASGSAGQRAAVGEAKSSGSRTPRRLGHTTTAR